jgi:hypothetical protein
MNQQEHIKIDKLEEQVEQINKTLLKFSENLVDIKKNMIKINTGLYGDDENDHIGVIAKQRRFESEIEHLKSEIQMIKDINTFQDTQIKAKKSLLLNISGTGKMILQIIINIIVTIAVLRGLIDIDALLK